MASVERVCRLVPTVCGDPWKSAPASRALHSRLIPRYSCRECRSEATAFVWQAA